MENTNNINSDIFSAIQNAAKKLTEKFSVDIQKLQENAKKSSEFQNTSAYLLSTYGWYISTKMSYNNVFMAFCAIKNHDIVTAEDILLKYYRNELERIKEDLIKHYPDRKKLLIESFKVHRQGMYFASTILFLSQADGICKGKIFRSKNNLKKYLDSMNSPEIINSVLGKESAIDVDTRKKDTSNYFSELNRHGVMHGLHSDYGNEINSLKALSLLRFISDFIEPYKSVLKEEGNQGSITQ